MYCPMCGREAQIVSDDNLLEEELLRQLLLEEEEEEKAKKAEAASASGKRTAPSGAVGRSQGQKSAKSGGGVLAGVIALIAVLVILSGGLYLFFQNKNDGSYPYQMQKAQESLEKGSYEDAAGYCQRALKLNPDDIEALLLLAEVYERMGAPEKAAGMFYSVIDLDPGNVDAFEWLIQYHEAESDYEAILKLKERAKGESVLTLFEDFQVKAPEFSMEPGIYEDAIQVGLTGAGEIFYALNGKDPVAEGEAYTEPIALEEQGELRIKAVARSQHGIYSDAVEGVFQVRYGKPKMPKAKPDSGTFYEPTFIELSGAEGARIYYTWDGTDPTASSAEYLGPIEAPEGNNILSAILIDKHGLTSDVLKCNYKYMPRDTGTTQP